MIFEIVSILFCSAGCMVVAVKIFRQGEIAISLFVFLASILMLAAATCVWSLGKSKIKLLELMKKK